MEDYAAFSVLDGLPPLVRRQRQLEAKILPLAPLVDDEKAVRQQIDALLVAAGIASNDGVTCLGYDVVHHARLGSARINADRLVEQLVAAKVDRALVLQVLADSTDTSEPSTWATVKPSKGSKVRAVPAKAGLRPRKHRA